MSASRPLARFAACAILLLGNTSPAWADAPIVIGPIHDEGSDVLGDCGSFQIVDNSVLNFTVRRMRNREGNVIRLIEEVWGVDNFTNSVTGKSLAGPFHNNRGGHWRHRGHHLPPRSSRRRGRVPRRGKDRGGSAGQRVRQRRA